jgi:glutamate-5-semialdehyde dehydrogenase
MNSISSLGQKAKEAEVVMRSMSTVQKNKALQVIADALLSHGDEILKANQKDLENAVAAGMSPGMQDRLRLTKERLDDIAEGMRQVADLPDPIGEIMDSWTLENGIDIRRVRVPMGVVGIIYESRPNVTPDAFSLCFKSGNVSFLRGGSDCINSNIAMVHVMRDALEEMGINPDVLLLVEDTSRDTVKEMMRANQYIDVLIPRGGSGLIRTVVENAQVPVIETGAGNCHVYVDRDADIEMAASIVANAKASRVSVCNACESLLIHKDIAEDALLVIGDALKEKNVEIRGDEAVCEIIPYAIPATEADWNT